MKSSKIPLKITKLIKQIQKDLDYASDSEYQKTVYKYFKQQIEIRGLRTKPTEDIGTQHWKTIKNSYTENEKKILALELFKKPHMEDRVVGMKYFNYLLKDLDNAYIDSVKNVILSGVVKDWGTIDGLCSRLLGPWSLLSKENTQYIALWRLQSDNFWVRRASCVAFVSRAKYGDNKPNYKGFSDLMFTVCQETVKYNERFNQLGNGWLVRNLSIHNRQKAIEFIEKNYDYYSREGLRYAVFKLDKKEKTRLMQCGFFQKNFSAIADFS